MPPRSAGSLAREGPGVRSEGPTPPLHHVERGPGGEAWPTPSVHHRAARRRRRMSMTGTDTTPTITASGTPNVPTQISKSTVSARNLALACRGCRRTSGPDSTPCDLKHPQAAPPATCRPGCCMSRARSPRQQSRRSTATAPTRRQPARSPQCRSAPRAAGRGPSPRRWPALARVISPTDGTDECDSHRQRQPDGHLLRITVTRVPIQPMPGKPCRPAPPTTVTWRTVSARSGSNVSLAVATLFDSSASGVLAWTSASSDSDTGGGLRIATPRRTHPGHLGCSSLISHVTTRVAGS